MAVYNVEKTAVVEWYEIVREAQSTSDCAVDEELESYLVYLLLRFMNQPDLGEMPLGMAFLSALQHPLMGRSMMLRNVGDQCLLITGLFPELAAHRLLRVGYYVGIGRRSYLAAAEELHHEVNASKLYQRLCAEFVTLMDVLQSMRNLGRVEQRLSQHLAKEIWEDTRSPVALNIIKSQK